MSRINDHRFTRPIQAIKIARESGDPKEVKKAFCYLIGVAKRFYTVDELAMWTDFLFDQIDHDEEMLKFIREPYIETGKFHIEENE